MLQLCRVTIEFFRHHIHNIANSERDEYEQYIVEKILTLCEDLLDVVLFYCTHTIHNVHQDGKCCWWISEIIKT